MASCPFVKGKNQPIVIDSCKTLWRFERLFWKDCSQKLSQFPGQISSDVFPLRKKRVGVSDFYLTLRVCLSLFCLASQIIGNILSIDILTVIRLQEINNLPNSQCVKSVCIRSYSGLYFPAFGLNTERYRVSLCIYSECEEIQTRITPNTDIFHAVSDTYHLRF